MKIKCLYNTGKALLEHLQKALGVTEYTEYGLLKVGKEYIVMGMLLGEGVLDYLIDDGGIISTYPYQLFEIVDNKISLSWHFRTFTKGDINYPFQEAVWGYSELVSDDNHYENLVEKEEEAHRIYFKRKKELEEEFSDKKDEEDLDPDWWDKLK